MREQEEKLNQLQSEKVELSIKIEDARSGAASQKISEQRRKRLQELEQEMSSLKRKMQEQSKALKLKDQADKNVNRLNTEIVVRGFYLQ